MAKNVKDKRTRREEQHAVQTAIKFERIERDCPFNKELRDPANNRDLLGDNPKPVRGLIYDWQVIVGGEVRGLFMPIRYARGYELHNLVGDGWKYPNSHTRRTTEAKANFHADVLRAMEEGHLLTVKQAAAEKAKRARAAAAALRKEHAQAVNGVIKSWGLKLYATMLEIHQGTSAAETDVTPSERLEKLITIHHTTGLLLARIQDEFPEELPK